MAENTKERIIQAAFSFYRTPLFREISLSEIAEKVGITKAAIFKHFKNKDALSNALREKVYADISVVLCEMQEKYNNLQGDEALPLVIEFISKHQEYMNYILSTLEEVSEDSFVLQLKKYGITLLNNIYNADGTIKDLGEYFQSVFVSTTMFVFVIIRQNINEITCLGEDERSLKEFSHNLTRLICDGLNGKDARISVLRLTEIDSICVKSLEGLKEIDRVLLAIAKVVSKSGFSKITIDKVAKELGMAKSSLYTWFANKNEMVKTLIQSEINQLYGIMVENMQKMQTSGERLYVMLQTVLAYLTNRPELLDVAKWLQMSDVELIDNSEKQNEIIDFFAKQEILTNLPDLGFGEMGNNLVKFSLGWFFALPVMLLIHGRTHNFSAQILQAAMKDMYFMVQFGVNNANKT